MRTVISLNTAQKFFSEKYSEVIQMYSNSFLFQELMKIHAKDFSKLLTNNEI